MTISYSTINLLLKMMSIDSLTGFEFKLTNYLIKNLNPKGAKLTVQNVNKNQKNLFYKWGNPKIIFCSHLDTVHPYLYPKKKLGIIYGRGACDAKGQIAVMYETCKQLYKEGYKNFGLLLLSDEEKLSNGAKLANKLITDCNYVIIGEPTENKLISSTKGTLLFEFNIYGKNAHSGYPEYGKNAIFEFKSFMDNLSKIRFVKDPILGVTNYNIGNLQSKNQVNVVSDLVMGKILFRTTFCSHENIKKSFLKRNKNIKIILKNESYPVKFFTLPGFKTGIASFGSDAIHLSNFGKKLLYGPGNIINAHTNNEYIKIKDAVMAVYQLKKLYRKLIKI